MVARALTVGSLLVLVACGSNSTGTSVELPRDRVDSVVVTPESVTVDPGATLQFKAEVSGNSAVLQTVTWSVEATAAGGPKGTIEGNGTYHAPMVSPPAPVRVVARSTTDPSKQGTAVVSFAPVAFAVEPAAPAVFPGDTVQFRAVLSGVPDKNIKWTASFGTIDSNGLYRAPANPGTDLVTAISAVGALSVLIDVQRRPPVIETISGPAATGEFITLTGKDLSQATALFPAESGPPIPGRVGSSLDTVMRVRVPIGAASGPLRVDTQGQPSQGRLRSNALSFQRAPNVLLRANRSDLAAGESLTLRVAWLGAPGPAPLTFETDVGSMSGPATYTAPATVAGAAFAHVRACVTATTSCSEVTLAIRPFRVDPTPALVPAGSVLDLTAVAAGTAVDARFALDSGGGALSASGHFTAPDVVEDAGQELLAAEYAGVRRPIQVGVTGRSPGAVNRLVEHIDHGRIDASTGAPSGAATDAVVTTGGKAYVLRRRLVGTDAVDDYFSTDAYTWIDVYDLADPFRPQWVGAIEAATRPTSLFAIPGKILAFSPTDEVDGGFGSMAVYDLGGTLPALVARGPSPGDVNSDWFRPVIDGERMLFFRPPLRRQRAFTVGIQPLGAGALEPATFLQLPLPENAHDGLEDASILGFTAAGNRVYATYLKFGPNFVRAGAEVGVWDLAASPPALVATLDSDAWAVGLPYLWVAGPLLVDSTMGGLMRVYDRTPEVPVQVGELPFPANPLATSGTRVLIKSLDRGLYVLETAGPGSPRIVTTLDPDVRVRRSAAWDGQVYAAQGLAGLGVYDVSVGGGPLPRSRLATFSEDFLEAVYGGVVNGHYLYTTGSRWLSSESAADAIFATWDISHSPPELVWTKLTSTVGFVGDIFGFAVALAADRLVRGTSVALEIWSLANPAAPVQLSSTPMEVSCIAVDGSIAWVGTLDGQLVALDLDGSLGPVEVGRLALGALPIVATPAGPGRLALALVGRGTGDLAIVDTTSPTAPALVSAAGLGVPTNGVAIDGTLAVAATDAGLATIDVSDLAHPVLLGLRALPNPHPFSAFSTAVPAYSVALHAGVAWVGSAVALHGFDLRNPAHPRPVARGPGQFSVLGVAFDGSTRAFAIGATFGGGVWEMDLSQPRNVIAVSEAERALQK